MRWLVEVCGGGGGMARNRCGDGEVNRCVTSAYIRHKQVCCVCTYVCMYVYISLRTCQE